MTNECLYIKKSESTSHFLTHIGTALQGTDVTSVELVNKYINDKGALAFAKTLFGTKVNMLDMSRNCITLQGSKELAKALKGTKVSQNIKLELNKIVRFSCK